MRTCSLTSLPQPSVGSLVSVDTFYFIARRWPVFSLVVRHLSIGPSLAWLVTSATQAAFAMRSRSLTSLPQPSVFSLVSIDTFYFIARRWPVFSLVVQHLSTDPSLAWLATARCIVGCIRNEDSLAHQPPPAFSLLACIRRYILFHRSSLACILLVVRHLSIDSSLAWLVTSASHAAFAMRTRSLTSLPQLSVCSLVSIDTFYVIARRSPVFRLWSTSFDRPITRVACDRGIVGCIRSEDSLAYQPSSAFSLLAGIHRYILFHRASLACISLVVQHLSIGPSLAWLATAVYSLACQPPFSFQSARLYPSIHSITSLDARLYFRLWCSIFRSAHHSRGLRQRYRRLHSQ